MMLLQQVIRLQKSWKLRLVELEACRWTGLAIYTILVNFLQPLKNLARLARGSRQHFETSQMMPSDPGTQMEDDTQTEPSTVREMAYEMGHQKGQR